MIKEKIACKQNKHDVFLRTYKQTVLLFILIILRREVQSSDIGII